MLAPFAASLIFGGLEQAIDAYREICIKADRTPRETKISYFIHICDDPEIEYFAAEGLIDYFTLSGLRSKSTVGVKLPPTMAYYQKIREALADINPEDLGKHSILVGSPQNIIDRLKEVEALGVEEVMLYFNYARKPDAMVREQMDRFMKDIAPAFEGSHLAAQAAQ
jgi:alkanesulfonate monooxygenase SsuD/methylene tetrahydromethanopterin reductase-like flavin-dependent oxidoreductase (luciferase family)